MTSPKIVKLSGAEISVSELDRARAVFLIEKYSSVRYLSRMLGLYANFVAGYEAFASTQPLGAASYREELEMLYKYEASLRAGLEQIRQGFSRGYVDVEAGTWFFDYLTGRRFEFGLELHKVGWRDAHYEGAHVGLYAWAQVALEMARKVQLTCRAGWAFPMIAEEDPQVRVEPRTTTAGGLVIHHGQEVPVSGVWQPLAVPSASPNYLRAGSHAKPAQRAVERIDWPYEPGPPPQPASSAYEYGPEPCSWQLLREDRRYLDGATPDESEYLDSSTEPPPWSPRV